MTTIAGSTPSAKFTYVAPSEADPGAPQVPTVIRDTGPAPPTPRSPHCQDHEPTRPGRPPEVGIHARLQLPPLRRTPGVNYFCRIDGKPFKPCSSPTVYRNLTRGKHTFRVKSVTLDGQVSPVRSVHFVTGWHHGR